MYTVLVILSLAQPTATISKPRFMEEKKVEYKDVLSSVEGGQEVHLYVGVPLPSDAPPGSIRLEAIPTVEPGHYRCFREDSGKAMMSRIVEVAQSTTSAPTISISPPVVYSPPIVTETRYYQNRVEGWAPTSPATAPKTAPNRPVLEMARTIANPIGSALRANKAIQDAKSKECKTGT